MDHRASIPAAMSKNSNGYLIYRKVFQQSHNNELSRPSTGHHTAS